MSDTNLRLEQLRFPTGRFTSPSDYSEATRLVLIDEIAALPKQLRDATEDLTDEQLDTRYRPEGWTLRQVVHHLADSHLNAYIRFKLALTEDNPTIRPYFEDRWAELPDGKIDPIDLSLDILEAVHRRWVIVLHNMEPVDFKRTYVHPEYGKTIPMDENLAIYAWHCRHHLAHITECVKRMG